MAVVELKNVNKSYQLGETRVDALKDVSLRIEPGEFTSLVGTSGSGKSTLLNIIGCLDRADSGLVSIAGRDVSGLDENAQCVLRNENMGFIFQSFNLIPVLNLAENVELPLFVKNELSSEERKKRVDFVVHAVGLEKFKHHRPDQLSGGQRQRVAIARALVTRPSLILADEPTANLDSKSAHMILDLMTELNRQQKATFLFCSHDEKLIGRVGRVIRIQDGTILE
jgi:putative ABC transport system ATP-binding protein